MNRVEQSMDYMDRGFGCAQSTLAPFAGEFGLDEAMALKLSTGFGSGMGRLCEVCGALTGGFMVLGLKYGRSVSDGTKYSAEVETTYAHVAELGQRFKEQKGTMLCRELLNCDLSNPDERARAREQGLFDTICRDNVRNVVRMLEEIIKS